tara:strand:+ start:42 stop:596 length:555 start_codon:yes stop_codon:yes gene_type:complete
MRASKLSRYSCIIFILSFYFTVFPNLSLAEYYPYGYVGEPIEMQTMNCSYKNSDFKSRSILQFIWGFFPDDPIYSQPNKGDLLSDKRSLLNDNNIEKIPVEILEWYPESPTSPDCIYEGFETKGIIEANCKDFYGTYTRDIKLDYNFIMRNVGLRGDASLIIKNTPIRDEDDLKPINLKGKCWD